jgi:hypothetical protein
MIISLVDGFTVLSGQRRLPQASNVNRECGVRISEINPPLNLYLSPKDLPVGPCLSKADPTCWHMDSHHGKQEISAID